MTRIGSEKPPARAGRLVSALALALAATVLVSLAAGPAAAQGLNLNVESLFGRGVGAPAEETAEDAAQEPDRDRAPELAAYGQLDDYVEEESSMVGRTTEGVSLFRQRAQRVFREAPGGLSKMIDQLAEKSPDGTAGYFFGVVILTILTVLIGRACLVIVAYTLFRPIMINAQRGPPPRTLGQKLPVLMLRFGLAPVGMVLNLAVIAALGIYIVPSDHEPTLVTAGLMIAGYVIYILVDNLWRMVLSPYLSDYRIPRITDRQARSLYLWITFTAMVGIVTRTYVQWMREMDLTPELVTLNAVAAAVISTVLAIAMIWRNGASITRMIMAGRAPEDAAWITRVGALLWRPVIIVYLLVALAEESFRQIMGLQTGMPLLAGAFITLLLGLLVFAGGMWVVELLFARRRAADAMREAGDRNDAAEDAVEDDAPAPSPAAGPLAAPAQVAPKDPLLEITGEAGDIDGDGDDEGGGPPPIIRHASQGEADPDAFGARPGRRLQTYEELAQRVVSLFALGTGVYTLVYIWFGDAAFANDTPIDRLQDTVDTLFLGYIAYQAARIWLDRKIAEEGADDISAEPGDEGGGASAASRLGTLLPLFRSAILVLILASMGVIVATELGINVAPLFAGAGIVGLAIGFGAQTLVRDILSGMFFLLDDAFRKGEYIDVGTVKGTVEKISLRSFQLRHHLGALNTIPFGEIQYLTNFSRDWVMMKLPLRLTYDTDVEKVRKLIKKLGQKLLEHPSEGPKFVQPLKSQGVYMMEDSAMIIRVKYMTRPGDQWTTRKLVYQELRELFEKEGVKFAHREVTVRIPGVDGAEELDDDRRAAIGAAARRAVDDADIVDGPGAGGLAAAEAR